MNTMVLSRTTRRAAPLLAIALGVITVALDLATVPLDGLAHQGGAGGPVTNGIAVAVGVVQETFEPTRASVWLSRARPDPFAPRAPGA